MGNYEISDQLVGRIKKVTSDDLKNFFKAEGVELVCPMCSSKALLVSFGTDEETGTQYIVPSVVRYLHIEGKIGGDFDEADCLSYKVTCHKCSHEIYFGASKIINWSELARASNVQL